MFEKSDSIFSKRQVFTESSLLSFALNDKGDKAMYCAEKSTL